MHVAALTDTVAVQRDQTRRLSNPLWNKPNQAVCGKYVYLVNRWGWRVGNLSKSVRNVILCIDWFFWNSQCLWVKNYARNRLWDIAQLIYLGLWPASPWNDTDSTGHMKLSLVTRLGGRDRVRTVIILRNIPLFNTVAYVALTRLVHVSSFVFAIFSLEHPIFN